MTSIRAVSAIELLNHVQNHGPTTMFRGQADIGWPLVPSIARFSTYVENGYDCIADLEDHLLEEFLRYSVPIRDFRSTPVIERLIHAQHFGVPTRLLDWSSNPLKALFFAVEDPKFDRVDGVVHVTEPNWWMEGTSHIKELKELTACFPELLHDRVSSQDACFIAFPLSKENMVVPELTLNNYPKSLNVLDRITIPRETKRDIRRQLATLGISHRTVYPGLDGVGRWVKSNLSNFQA